MKTLLTAMLLAMNVSICLAQAEFRPGYYVTNSGDTVRGLIDFRGDIYNAKYCAFKASADSDPREFFPGDIKSYRFSDGRLYESLSKADSVGQDSIYFYECLLRGQINLFFLRTANGDYYFVQDKNGRIDVAQNNQVTYYGEKGTPHVKNSNQYKGVFTYYFSQFPSLKSQISNLQYTRDAILKITRKFHEVSNMPYTVFEKRVKKDKLEVSIGLLACANTSNYSVVAGSMREMKGNTNGVGFVIEASRRLVETNERMQGIGRLSYSKLKWQGDSQTASGNATFGSDITAIKLNVGFRYVTPPTHRVRPFFGLVLFGEGLYFSKYWASHKIISSYEFPEAWRVKSDLNFGLAPGLGLQAGRFRFNYAFEISRKSVGTHFARYGHEFSLTYSFKSR